jgi:hypothetical protein
VEHLAVAYALREKTLSRGERDPVGAPQHPPAVFLAVVGEALAGVPEHLGQQFGERHMLGQRDVDAPGRRADRDPGQTDAHDSFPIEVKISVDFRAVGLGGWMGGAERSALYLPLARRDVR